MRNINENNFIIFSVNNFKKTLFEFYKKEINCFNLNYIYFNKKEYIFLYFTIDDYLIEKEKFASFLNDNDIYFNIISVKYKKNFYEFNFFEEEFVINSDNFFIEEILFIVNYHIIYKISKNKFLLFLLIKILFDLNTSLQCQLYIKQHQN